MPEDLHREVRLRTKVELEGRWSLKELKGWKDEVQLKVRKSVMKAD